MHTTMERGSTPSDKGKARLILFELIRAGVLICLLIGLLAYIIWLHKQISFPEFF